MSSDNWEYDVGLTNTPPRRRTEPAITVTIGDAAEPLDLREFAQEAFAAGQEYIPTFTCTVGNVNQLCGHNYVHGDGFRWTTTQKFAFAPAEVEAILTFGSDRYAKQAMVCDEAREQHARDEYEADRLALAEFLQWCTDSDDTGATCERMDRHAEAEKERVRSRLANLPRPLPNEHPSDYACRTGMHHAARMGLTYDEWAERVRLEMAAVAEGRPVT